MDPIARQGMESLKRPTAPQRRSAKTYTEADIARLEADNLTDPQVGTGLLNAYYQKKRARPARPTEPAARRRRVRAQCSTARDTRRARGNREPERRHTSRAPHNPHAARAASETQRSSQKGRCQRLAQRARRSARGAHTCAKPNTRWIVARAPLARAGTSPTPTSGQQPAGQRETLCYSRARGDEPTDSKPSFGGIQVLPRARE